MSETIKLDSGLVEMRIDGTDRVVKFNPSDSAFLRTLYSMLMKMKDIAEEKEKAIKEVDEEDFIAKFDIVSERDKQLRAVADGVFGDGFCRDVFGLVDLTALNGDGVTIFESLCFAMIDRMDEDVRAKMAKRDATIAKYTAKYDKYRKHK